MAQSNSKELVEANLAYMQNGEHYEQFPAGSFPELPVMEGYTLRFKDFKQYEVYLVLNTTEGFEYENPLVEEDKFVIMVINISSLEYFLENLEQYLEPIADVLKSYADKDEMTDRELPYGYMRDNDGQIKVNPVEATVVKKIFKEYPNWKSIRKVATIVKSDYSFVHDILHDARYVKMPIQIVPEIDVRRAFQVIQSNRKNKHQKNRYKTYWK